MRVLFLHNFAYAKFRENKSSPNGEITLSTTDIGKSYTSCEIFWLQVCLVNAIRENKILAKISGFTVTGTSHKDHVGEFQ